jgi:hypothetical protein
VALALKDLSPAIRDYAVGALRVMAAQEMSAPAASKLLFAALADEDVKVHGDAAAVLDALNLIKTVPERLAVNELMARDALEAYGHAQEDFFVATWDEHKIHYYASSFKELNLDKLAPAVQAAAGGAKPPTPYFGYVFKPLDGQTAHAPGGAKRFRVDDKLLHGHALLAYPERYGETGMLTLIVADDGSIFAKDLGPATVAHAAEMTQLDPDDSWTKTKLRPRDEGALHYHPQEPDATPLEF